MIKTENTPIAEQELSTEEKILAAARSVFTKKGMSGARMQDIADEAGINKALLHYYFRSKEKLFDRIFEEASNKMFSILNSIIADEKLSVREKIKDLIENYINMAIANPYIPAFVMGEANQNPDFIKEYLIKKISVHKQLIAHFQEAISLGEIKPTNPVQLFMNVMSLAVFPFIVRPIFQAGFGVTDEQFNALMEQRKKHLVEFIMAAIKP
ncbi:TetR/AcrR family transcriptional regulator [Thermoflexibacter ruber]|uniref:DNA-binding transcriptional regulator, AcrR family n=1 Tax=Thermoflexibacter ruber TaxID=1003 RepID=A0A1I2FFR2_9BACT|nr:TetR/AcrR family transcriptional regulator [Thermoflexibacter ruber]SFF03588.1 DNA-binding transcriptional regulator, AcrR family [Thermoflexibacter ruber]